MFPRIFAQDHLFSSKTLVVSAKTNCFLEKAKKQSFWRRAVEFSKRLCFGFWFSLGKVGFSVQNLFLPRKSLVFPLQTIFFLGKVCISLQDQSFPSKECVFLLLFARVTNKCCQ